MSVYDNTSGQPGPDFGPPAGQTATQIQTRTARARMAGQSQTQSPGFHDRLATSQSAGSKQVREIGKAFRRNARDFLPPPYPLDDLAALMESNATHYACVLAKASAISSTGWKLVPDENEMALHAEVLRLVREEKRTPDEDKRMKYILRQLVTMDEQRKALDRFFERPNPDDTFQEVNYRTDVDIEALGIGFWELVRDLGGWPSEIYHMPAISCRLLANGTGVAQVRDTASIPFPAAITPTITGGGLTVVYFKFFGKPWIMDWRNGRVHGTLIAENDAKAFVADPENTDKDGKALYALSAGPDGAPDGFRVAWLVKNGQITPLPVVYWANEVVYWKNYSVKNGDTYGVPDIISALDATAGDRGAHRSQLDFFENYAVPRAIFFLKGFPPGEPVEEVGADEDTKAPDPLQTTQQFFDRELRGQQHRTLILESPPDLKNPDGSTSPGGDFKFEKISDEIHDASHLNYLKNNRDEIMRAERTPAEMIASFDHTARPSTTGVSIGLEVFKGFVVRLKQESRERRITRLIKDGFGFPWNFKFNEVDTLDELRAMQIAKGYGDMHALSTNEIRRRYLGLEPVAGGDRMFVVTPTGMVFLDEIDRLSTSDLTKTPDNPLEPAGQGSPQGRGNTKVPAGDKPQRDGKSKNDFSISDLEIIIKENAGIPEFDDEDDEDSEFTEAQFETLKRILVPNSRNGRKKPKEFSTNGTA